LRIILRKVLDLSQLADPTKAPGNVCMHQHATPIGDNRVGCIAGELVAQLNESSEESAGQ
jgi:hypothetical protein